MTSSPALITRPLTAVPHLSTTAVEIMLPEPLLDDLTRRAAFTFEDGTTQRWTLDQIFDSVTGARLPQLDCGFTLCNSLKRALAAAAYPLSFSAPPAAAAGDIFLCSPDLRDLPAWQAGAGYRLDLRRDYGSACHENTPARYAAQLQALVWDKDGGAWHLFVEWGEETATPHPIARNTTYHLQWRAPIFADPRLCLMQIRLRLTMPLDHADAHSECAPHGEWLVCNVYPLR